MWTSAIFSLVFFAIFAESRSSTGLKNGLSSSEDWRIVQGEETKRHEFPWMAMVSDSIMGLQVCGASLISKRYVLTAGHCMIGVPLDNPPILRIRLGAHNKTWLEDPHVQVRSVRKIINHPDYKPIFLHDFSLLELEEDVELNDYIKPICLAPTNKDLTGEIAVVAGWGRTSHGGPDSKILRKAEVAVVDQAVCAKKFKGSAEVLDDMICAGGKGKDACQRDSGGPLMWKDNAGTWRLIGIVSWGDDCGSMYFPGVYSRVSSIVSWLKGIIGDDLC